MPNLYTIVAKKESSSPELSEEEVFSVLYHDIFDYPLSFPELIKWKAGKSSLTVNVDQPVSQKNGYFFVEGKEGLVYKKLLRKRISDKKIEIARRAAKILSFIPGIKMLALTGSLAMGNASEEGDIDLLAITKEGTLWSTRLLAYALLGIFHIPFRRFGRKDERNKLCLNMWLDESNMEWPKKERNLYTAHEIAQVVPLVDKDGTYKKFLSINMWILDFWPNSVRIEESKDKKLKMKSAQGVFEKICYEFQYRYMENKITREVITPTRAIFHPQDWGKIVLSRLSP